MKTITILRAYFAENIPHAGTLQDEQSLLTSGLLDSLTIVELITFIENKFGIELSDETFDPDHFETLKSISELIASLNASAGSASEEIG